ncbi:hypothetical protein ACFRCG_07755 [Embleya sp. NPDC056575]|uniref:hypothetical protein n=1 Tax=unclassified Embleya TaxID=2699296 RepID=UPI003676070F
MYLKITVLVVAILGIVSTPLIWLLDGPDNGQVVAASVQGATGVVALIWALLQKPPPAPGAQDVAVDTGTARSTGGGATVTGVRRPGGAGNGSARVERSGDATAHGRDSSASTGIDYGP